MVEVSYAPELKKLYIYILAEERKTGSIVQSLWPDVLPRIRYIQITMTEIYTMYNKSLL